MHLLRRRSEVMRVRAEGRCSGKSRARRHFGGPISLKLQLCIQQTSGNVYMQVDITLIRVFPSPRPES
jgi:hypothetical protein